MQSNFAYDGSGRPIAQTVKNGLGRESYKRSYHWNGANQLLQTVNHLKGNNISYSYDALEQLVSATGKGMESEFKCPDSVGNLYETPERTDKTYSSGGKLERDKKWHYYYDTLGNLKLKSPFPLHAEEPSKKWQSGCWSYDWFANGMLKSVKKPNGLLVSFEYDALGRRTAKIAGDKITRYLWDGNVLLHEWCYDIADRPKLQIGDLGELFYEGKEPVENVVTWVYEEGSFVPSAKIIGEEKFSIISDYIGRPIQAYHSNGEKVWETDYDIYGRLVNLRGEKSFIPFQQLGQYEDEELGGLYYNRFRYYDSENGLYISIDPKSIHGGFALYGYVNNSTLYVDPFGLDPVWNPTSNRWIDSANGQFITRPTNLMQTNPNEAFYWSGRTNGVGGELIAGSIAKQNGGTTLEMLIAKNKIKMPMWDPGNPIHVKEWGLMSEAYAIGSSGKVRGVIGDDLRVDNIWEGYERNKLMTNSKVTSIEIIDPSTGKSKGFIKGICK